MDMAILLLVFKQGTWSLNDYVQEYLDLTYFSDLPDRILIDFFCDGLNKLLKSRLIFEGPRLSLSQFMDYALLMVGSTFTVGVAEAHNPTHTHVMAAALEHNHKMADTTAPFQVTTDLHDIEL